MIKSPLLVTGATGNVGRAVLHSALSRDFAPTAAMRNPHRSGQNLPAEIPKVALDFYEPVTWAAALAGQRYLFLVRPPAIADVKNTLNPFIDCAKQAGVEHIVFLSVAGAGKNSLVPHRQVEDYLASLDDHYTSLRPGFFAQNLQDAYRQDLIEDDRILLPAGHAPVNWIDVRDVADVAALVFENPVPHRAQAYTLTGPKSVSWESVVEILSDVLGRNIRYEAVSIPRYVFHLRKRGLPWRAIAVQTIIHVLLRLGQGDIYDETLERLLGHSGRTIETYIRDHADIWQQ